MKVSGGYIPSTWRGAVKYYFEKSVPVMLNLYIKFSKRGLEFEWVLEKTVG